MHKLVLAILVVFCLATVASAANIKQVIPFNNISGASGAVKTSSAINAVYFPNRTVHVSGVDLAGTAFKNMSGTVIAQCAPTPDGPWVTCVANDYAQTAVSRTTNGAFTWKEFSSYIRFHWTAGTVGGKLKAWVNLSE